MSLDGHWIAYVSNETCGFEVYVRPFPADRGTLPSQYETLVCGTAGRGGEVALCNAGHCPPVLVRDGADSTFVATGLPPGLFGSARYAATEARLRPGESLVLCSDGLSEARNSAGAEYGAQRVSAAIVVCGGCTAEAISGHW